MSFYVYILRDEFNHLYIGETNNLNTRQKQHQSKSTKSAKYIKDNGDFKLVYKEEYPTLIEAMRREKQLKGWRKAKKEALIAGNLELLKIL
jgi:predicted GIY-YIG superfamily endonuclease